MSESFAAANVKHVNRHLTPLAVLVVLPALLLELVPDLPTTVVIASGLLLATAVVINLVTAGLIETGPTRLGHIRIYSNYVINVCLMMLLYRSWPVVWILLLLSGLGNAVYQDRRRTLVASLVLAATLLATHGLHGATGTADWLDVGVKAAAIVGLSLFVNGARAVRV